MSKRWKILISIFLISILSLYVIQQIAFMKEPVSNEFPLRQAWKTHVKGLVVGLSMASEDILLVRTSTSFNALDPKNGQVIWQHSLSWQPDPKPAIARNGKVYLTDGDYLIALDQENGSVLWQQDIPHSDSWVTDASENTVVVNQVGIDIRVFDAKTGEFLWRKPVCLGYVKAFISGHNIIVPCDGIIAIDSASGEISWKGTNNDIIGNTDFSDGILYYHIDYAYAFDSHSQKDLWNTTVVHNGIENFRVLQDRLFYRDADRLCMLEREDGHLVWCTQFPYPQTPALLGNIVYSFNGNHKKIRAIQASDGNEIGFLGLSNINYFSIDRDILTSNETLLFFSNGEDVYAFGD